MRHHVVVTDRAIMKLHSVETLDIVPLQDNPPYLILLHSEAHEIITISRYYHGTHFNRGCESPLQTSIFYHIYSNFPVKIQKTGDTYQMAYG